MAKKLTRLFADTAVLSKYGKVLRRLVEFIATAGLLYTKHQESVGFPYYYSCDGIGEAATDNIVIADAVEGTPVTEISENAFAGLQNLVSVRIPETVTRIGTSAFARCPKLTTINLPHGLTAVEAGTFQICGSLRCVYIPDGVTKIDSQAFEGCSYLMYVRIPVSVTNIADLALANCNAALSIYYTGTQAQWDSIVKGPTWNAPNYNSRVIYEWSGELPVLPTSEVSE